MSLTDYTPLLATYLSIHYTVGRAHLLDELICLALAGLDRLSEMYIQHISWARANQTERL